MSKWKASMPREAPESGMAHVVIALKTEHGQRLELTGQIDVKTAHRLLNEGWNAPNKPKVK